MTTAPHAASVGWHRPARLLLLLAVALLLLLPQAATAASAPFRVVGSSSVDPGDQVTFSGEFVDATPDHVTLTMRPGGTDLGSTAVSGGKWTLSTVIPASTPPGSYRVFQQASDNGTELQGLDSVLLQVKAPPEPPPPQQGSTQPPPIQTGQGSAPTTVSEPDASPATSRRARSRERAGAGSDRRTDPRGSESGGPRGPRSEARGVEVVKKATPWGGRFEREKGGGGTSKPGDEPTGALSAKNTSTGVRDFQLPWASIALGGGGIVLIIAITIWGVVMAFRRPDDPMDDDDGPGDDPKPDRPGPWDPLEAELQEMIAEERARRRDPVAPA